MEPNSVNLDPHAQLPDPNARWIASTLGLGERSDYKKVWNRQAQDVDVAKLAVAGYGNEEDLALASTDTLQILRDTVGYGPNDLILEIGCGVGRVGKALSPHVLHWFGTDISGEMLKHAARRLQACDNVTLIELAEVGLREMPEHTLDVVYCTVVFMHLYEWDRYRYVAEAFRVLRPGGRCYFDNMDLTGAPGWRMFEDSGKYPVHRRPAHLSMVSTGEELETYARRAGFVDIAVHRLPQGWVAVSGTKPVNGLY
jgi:SAM-dependent methyltransferase